MVTPKASNCNTAPPVTSDERNALLASLTTHIIRASSSNMRKIECIAIAAACIISLATFLGSWKFSYSPSSSTWFNASCQQSPSTAGASSTTPAGASSDTNAPKDAFLLSCLRTILTNHQLPIGEPNHPRLANAVRAHHYDAQRLHLWNADSRFDPLKALEQTKDDGDASISASPPCSVWELGAHTRADDTATFLKRYAHCQYHAYEPVEEFAVQLQNKWKSESRVTAHAYGVGESAQEFSLPKAALKGQSTFIAESGGANVNTPDTTTTARIVPFQQALDDAGGQYPTLLHMNCEGCEWDFLPQAHAAGFLQQVPVIQIGTHNYGAMGLGPRIWQLCEIRYLLSQTHDMVEGGVAFAWERWVRRV